jgi:hypothetical protein
MRFSTLITTLAASIVVTAPAWAGIAPGVPEISATGSLAALTLVAGVAAIIWERRRHSR